MKLRPTSSRHTFAALITLVITVALAATLPVVERAALPDPGSLAEALGGHHHSDHDHNTHDHNTCPADMLVRGTLPGEPDSCAHADAPPPGVDVDKNVSTRILEAREGSAAAAVEAAQDQGVPVAAEFAAATDRVPCDGDGTSGYRTQAMYVVSADRPNRYASVVDQIKQWAAGVNTVFNLSAAKTGGVRNVRYVTTDNGDGTCSPSVLNITLPAGSNASFNSTITAMKNAGYTSPARKYLMWVDGTGYCGIAQTYLSSIPGQDNPNNGAYPQFARTDTACWGTASSVEAHELSHTFGSVQGDAPHATRAGHCWDESDRMCYADGGGFAMRQDCAADQEVLFDCNDDDYYSTYPPSGSYLATRWNTANSRFLIGGGDGVGGGTLGVPTRLGGTLSVNNPAVPGLPTQAALDLEVPDGRTTTIAWKASRSDCTFTDATAEQTTITCAAKSAAATLITATVTDSTGEKITRTSDLTFATTSRASTGSLTIDTTTSASYEVCPRGKAFLSARIIDTASGVGVKGIAVSWYRQVGTAAPTRVATGTTGSDGVASPTTATALLPGSYTAQTTAVTAFPAITTSATTVTEAASACSTTLTASIDEDSVQAGTPVIISGSLTRPQNGSQVPASGTAVSVFAQPDGSTRWTSAGTAVTGRDGTYRLTVKPTVSTTYQARLVASTTYQAATSAAVPLTVEGWDTAVTTGLSHTTVMAGTPVTVTGTLTQSDGTNTSGMPAAPVSVTYPTGDGRTSTSRATTNSSGNYSVVVKPLSSGPVVVTYAGKSGWSSSTSSSALTVEQWDSELTVSVNRNASTGTVTVSGTLVAIDSDGASVPKASATVQVIYQATATRTATANVRTTAQGTFSIGVKPQADGDVVVRYAGTPGWGSAEAPPVRVDIP